MQQGSPRHVPTYDPQPGHGFRGHWRPATALSLRRHSPLLGWLRHADSLTSRLKAHCQGRFAVQILTQHWGRARPAEAQALGLSLRERVLVREVLLKGNDQPWVWARSILPERSLRGPLRHLRWFDDRPLGGWLFRQPGLQRDPLEITRLSAGDRRLPLFLRDTGQTLWGRRSVFRVHGKAMLVGEVFLPDFVDSLEVVERGNNAHTGEPLLAQ